MGIIGRAIRLPVTVTVGGILIILFGFISFFRVPVQLTPDVEKPKISVNTVWSGASPEEVEKEIIILITQGIRYFWGYRDDEPGLKGQMIARQNEILREIENRTYWHN